ncbi:DUF2892 domain-containing protein [Pseudomonadota bacterium]
MTNVGGTGRTARILAGALLLVLTFVGPLAQTLSPWGLLGFVPLLTGLIGWCTAYRVFGLKTCSDCS